MEQGKIRRRRLKKKASTALMHAFGAGGKNFGTPLTPSKCKASAFPVACRSEAKIYPPLEDPAPAGLQGASIIRRTAFFLAQRPIDRRQTATSFEAGFI